MIVEENIILHLFLYPLYWHAARRLYRIVFSTGISAIFSDHIRLTTQMPRARRSKIVLLAFLWEVSFGMILAVAAPAVSPAVQQYLDAHNNARVRYGAENLTWSSTLASTAQSWASECIPAHSNGTLGPYGENMAAGTGMFTIDSAMALFLGTECEIPNTVIRGCMTQALEIPCSSVQLN